MAIEQNKYLVKKMPSTPEVAEDTLDALTWNRANVLGDFKNPWNSIKIGAMEFRALHDNKNLYFRFDVQDSSIYVDEIANFNENIGASDRVELFFRRNENLDPYYCMEIDSTARIMDFKARPNKNFDFGWGYPKDKLSVQSCKTKDGYKVTGIIRIDFLNHLGLLQSNLIETGIYRAKYIKNKDGAYTPLWTTWIDSKTKSPDFHVPSSFGILKLEDYDEF